MYIPKIEPMDDRHIFYEAPRVEEVIVETESGLLDNSGVRNSYGKAQEDEWD